MEDRTEMTLPEALGEYARANGARFHMPGHKGRGLYGFDRGDAAQWDVTELTATDNLHRPEGVLKSAQQAMARAYGARESFFCVNGSTGAVTAMLLSLQPGERLLLARDAHRSALSGAALGSLPTTDCFPPYDEERGLFGLITPELLDRRLEETGATAALVTSPNYFGMCADVPGLARVAHRRGALLLVDGAHGAHFPFSPLLPTGLGGYADMWCHSQHKTMNALTQAASLHLGDCRIEADRVRRILAMVETTSPSYLLMSSLDWSVYIAPRQDWTGLVGRMEKLAGQIGEIPDLAVLEKEQVFGAVEQDPTRLVIDVTGRGYTGFQAAALLEQAGVFVEMADERRLALITSPEDDPAWYGLLLTALRGLPKRKALVFSREDARLAKKVYGQTPVRCRTLREAVFAPQEQVPLGSCAGRICGEPLGAYPPGVAAVTPGERITQETADYLQRVEQMGAALFGVRGGKVFVTAE